MGIKRLVVVAISIFLCIVATGCNSNQPKEYMIFGEGQDWSAQYIETASESSGKEGGLTLTFSYKGDINGLMKVKSIVFSYGTSEGNIAETVNYDNGVDKAVIPVDFKGDFIRNIMGKEDEKILVIVECDGKKDSFNLSQYIKE